jgi:hypothetical protein
MLYDNLLKRRELLKLNKYFYPDFKSGQRREPIPERRNRYNLFYIFFLRQKMGSLFEGPFFVEILRCDSGQGSVKWRGREFYPELVSGIKWMNKE